MNVKTMKSRDREEIRKNFLKFRHAWVDPMATFYPTSLTLIDDGAVQINDDENIYKVTLDQAIHIMASSSSLSFECN